MKTLEQRYKKLDDISHVLLRPGRYIGSTKIHSDKIYTFDDIDNKFKKEDISWCPALIKIFDEIICNSVDFSKTKEGKNLKNIKVNLDLETGIFSIYDDGGISVKIHKEYNQYIPELIFELKAGSNFDDSDESFSTGQNGEGAALTKIFSEFFKVETCDGKNNFEQLYKNNGKEISSPIITPRNDNYTRITWKPDYTKFSLEKLDENNYKKIYKKVIDIANCNPSLNFYFNENLIKTSNFKDYISKYTSDFCYDENKDWKIGLSYSDEGFEQVSFVNSTETYLGGTHINYILNPIIEKIRELLKKKCKIEIKNSDVKNNIKIFINCNIKNPRYSSQSKEELITESKEYNTFWEISNNFLKDITNSNIIKEISNWYSLKEKILLENELKRKVKDIDKKDPKKIEKFYDATSKEREKTSLLIVEGDSALSGVLSGMDRKLFGAFPLRGKPLNVFEMNTKDLLENKEIQSLLIILGLQVNKKVENISNLRFGRIIITTDQDLDGFHIRGLLMNFFYKFWPELFSLGIIYILNTPLIKVKKKNEIIPFYSNEDFIKWKEDNKNINFTFKYYKGLGTSDAKEWKEYFSEKELNNNLIKISLENNKDGEMFKLLFSKENGISDLRKNWLNISE